MTIAGNLRTMGISDMLQWLSSSHKTGTLVVDGPTYTKKVYFRRGNVVAVASDNPTEMLGYYLVGWRYLSEDDLQYLIEMQQHFQILLGELVVTLGHLTQDAFDRMLRIKTEETIYDLLLWEEGNFRFLDTELPERDFLEVQLPVETFLLEGYRQRDERKHMMRQIPSTSHRPRLLSRPDTCTLNEVAIAAAIDGVRSIEEIALECRLPEFAVLNFVFSGIAEESVAIDSPSDIIRLVPGQSDAPWLEQIREVDDRIRRGRFLDALHLLNAVEDKHGDRPQAAEVAATKRQELETVLDEASLPESVVLEPAVALDELMNLDCDPAEGFVLSRINGRYSMEEVVSQLPGSRLINHVIVHNLLRRGFIKARDTTAVRRYRSTPHLDPGDPFPDESLPDQGG